jgi:hypothetical protein
MNDRSGVQGKIGRQWAKPAPNEAVNLRQPRIDRCRSAAEMKARQTSKIRELGDALVTSGLRTLDEQARALGLPRSTTWTLLASNHKASGLSATVINRMLAAAQVPLLVRARILEYLDEKIAGLYGHSKIQLRRFGARLAPESVVHSQAKLAEAAQKTQHYRQDLRPVRFAWDHRLTTTNQQRAVVLARHRD